MKTFNFLLFIIKLLCSKSSNRSSMTTFLSDEIYFKKKIKMVFLNLSPKTTSHVFIQSLCFKIRRHLHYF